MIIGDRTDDGTDEIFDKYDCTNETFRLDPETKNDTDFHILPPDPDEEVKSRVRSSQELISLGAVIITTGAERPAGADIVTFWGSFDFHFWHKGSTLEVHRALTTPPRKSQISPTDKYKDFIDEISSEESLVHTQRKERREEEGREKYVSQLNGFNIPLRFVAEEKVTRTLLASNENSARCTEGGGNDSSNPFTRNRSPTGNTTWYSWLEGPLREICKR
jgi:hypothetical protein